MASTLPLIIHRYGLFRPDGTAISASTRVHVGSLCLETPGQVRWGGHDLNGQAVDCVHVPMDDHLQEWHRLRAEWDIWCDPEARDQEHGAPRRLQHADGTQHNDYKHVLLPGSFSWQHTPHERVAERATALAGMDDVDLARHLCGPDAATHTTQYQSDVRLKAHSIHVDLRYDGSVGLATDAHLHAAGGEPLGHGHTYVHRLPPGAWHQHSARKSVAIAVMGHHRALDLEEPRGTAETALQPHTRLPDEEKALVAADQTAHPGGYHPSVRLDHRHIVLLAHPRGGVVVHLGGHLLNDDGDRSLHLEHYTHPFSEDEWHSHTLPDLIAEAMTGHYRHLHLNTPRRLPDHLEKPA